MKKKSKGNQYFDKQVVLQQIKLIDPIKAVQALRYKKYDSVFNFFLSKPINDICDEIRSHETILIKQFEYLDLENEYFKRYYGLDQFSNRIKLLGDLYQQQKALKKENPRLNATQLKKYLDKRKKRLKKMQKKLKQIELEAHEQFATTFLNEDQVVSSSKSSSSKYSSQKSFDSSVYNIYEDYEDIKDYESLAEKYVKGSNCIIQESEYDIKEVQDQSINHLIMDFDDLNKIQILNDYNKLKQKEVKKKKIKLNLPDSIKYKIDQQIPKKEAPKKTKYFGTKFQNCDFNKNNGFKTLRMNTNANSILEFTNYMSPKMKQKHMDQFLQNRSIQRIKRFNDIQFQQNNNNLTPKLLERFDHRSYQDLKYFRQNQSYISSRNPPQIENRQTKNIKEYKFTPILYQPKNFDYNKLNDHKSYIQINNKVKSPESYTIRQKAMQLIHNNDGNSIKQLDKNNYRTSNRQNSHVYKYQFYK